ncbi:hypothetical protein CHINAEXTREME_14755 [Halobiforma lacisalsi AJ5]|uniref:Uncharacterized protein n=1 Tax=Natronobacterium lacisalsi AJ5 TaxID=358396 RepID=M0LAD3_NATLA|nr:hypothetical protein [Halobiforma lacisalsi]APW98954.1 hypothetical protein CHINAEXTREME_14755 [Halobiforma lacisalsi AJ5]EMA30526.1 hypothetical protein C445_16512 [Halobiforma lacisalsi AJ5]
MDREGFVKLAIVAFGIVFLSFVLRGVGQILVGFETARLLSAPVAVGGFLLLVYLFVRATFDAIGVWEVK